MSNLNPRVRRLVFKFKQKLRILHMSALAPLSANRVLPDFLLVGAMKSGTTSLFHYLTQHPGIVQPRTKEIHFFNSPSHDRLGQNWYRAHFPLRKEMEQKSYHLGYPALTGEATPAMVKNAYASNAAALVPNAKIIMIFRNPVDRAYSHYQHQLRWFIPETLSFWEALQKEPERTERYLQLNSAGAQNIGGAFLRYNFAERGKYIRQIENWLKFFDREQLKILNFEDLKKNPGRLCNDVYAFLGLPAHEVDTAQKLHLGGYRSEIDDRSREFLTELYRPYNRRLFDFLGEDWGWPS